VSSDLADLPLLRLNSRMRVRVCLVCWGVRCRWCCLLVLGRRRRGCLIWLSRCGCLAYFFNSAVSAAWCVVRGEGVSAEGIARVSSAVFGVGDLELLADVVCSEKFRLALENRGVVADRVDGEGLSVEMVACVRALSDPQPGLTVRQRLRVVGFRGSSFRGGWGLGLFVRR